VISVPAPVLWTTSLAPMDVARSRMPTKPQCPAGAVCDGSKPWPSSRTRTESSRAAYVHVTVTVRHRAWRRTLSIASVAMATISDSTGGGDARGDPVCSTWTVTAVSANNRWAIVASCVWRAISSLGECVRIAVTERRASVSERWTCELSVESSSAIVASPPDEPARWAPAFSCIATPAMSPRSVSCSSRATRARSAS
jgi:hypothetical protein